MKKVFSILMVAFAMTAMIACGDENNNSENPSGNNPGDTSSVTGSYRGTVGDLEHTLTLGTAGLCTYQIWNLATDEEEVDAYGDYTYSNGRGTINFNSNTYESDLQGDATFTVSGDKLTLTFNSQNVTMTKAQ